MRIFPIKLTSNHIDFRGCHNAVPWGLVAPHEAQVMQLYGKSLEYFEANGGMTPVQLHETIIPDIVRRRSPAQVEYQALTLLREHGVRREYMTGRVASYNPLRGFGFVDSTDAYFFVHGSALHHYRANIKVGDIVNFNLVQVLDKNPMATDIRLA